MRYVNAKELLDFLEDNEGASFDDIKAYVEEIKLQMYTSVVCNEDGSTRVIGYRFGEPFEASALYFEGGFKTEQEALEKWYKEWVE